MLSRPRHIRRLRDEKIEPVWGRSDQPGMMNTGWRTNSRARPPSALMHTFSAARVRPSPLARIRYGVALSAEADLRRASAFVEGRAAYRMRNPVLPRPILQGHKYM